MSVRGTAKYVFEDIIGISDKIRICKEKAVKASKTSSPVLIFGETGTGKELFVQAIHNSSNRVNEPFIAQNCAAIPTNLLESTLFGTARGSFTGAAERMGLFELANSGTLYLDELNSMPLELQGKLLRVLQEGTIRRVGSTSVKRVEPRIIASLNEKPESLLRKGTLRNDLYYRLNVVRIDLPPLRERREDVPVLAEYFMRKFNACFRGKLEGIEKNGMEALVLHSWEGNVRELEHTLEGVFNLKLEGYVELSDLIQTGFKQVVNHVSLKEKLKEAEKSYILVALCAASNNLTRAAEILEIPRQTLQSKMKRLNIK